MKREPARQLPQLKHFIYFSTDEVYGSAADGQAFKEGWIVAKAQYYSLLRERGPVTARERVYKLLPTDTYLSLNHIIRLESSVNMVVDSKSKSKPKP